MSAAQEHIGEVFQEPAPRAVGAPFDATPVKLSIMGHTHEGRADAEVFVRKVFLRAYRARLDSFYPLLLGITWPNNRYAAVAGLRSAAAESLFSEYYLEQPVESILGTERSRIVEVGNLAPASVGQTRWLIGAVTALLAGAGFSRVVFTAVPRLKNAFSRMGLPLVQLGEARADSLPEDLARDWGSYYDHNPAVFSGDIQLGFHAFTRIVESHPELRNILQQAYTAGAAFASRSVSEAV